jgi:hypothetical protein
MAESATLFSETVPPFDAASIPAPIFGPAIRSPSAGQAASAVKSFSAVSPRSSFIAIIRLDALSSIAAGSSSAVVRYGYMFSFFAQNFFLLLFYNCNIN